jgi:hypothetical protein
MFRWLRARGPLGVSCPHVGIMPKVAEGSRLAGNCVAGGTLSRRVALRGRFGRSGIQVGFASFMLTGLHSTRFPGRRNRREPHSLPEPPAACRGRKPKTGPDASCRPRFVKAKGVSYRHSKSMNPTGPDTPARLRSPATARCVIRTRGVHHAITKLRNQVRFPWGSWSVGPGWVVRRRGPQVVLFPVVWESRSASLGIEAMAYREAFTYQLRVVF